MLMRVYRRELISAASGGMDRKRTISACAPHWSNSPDTQERSREDPCGIETDNIKRAWQGLKSCKSTISNSRPSDGSITTPANEKMVQGTLASRVNDERRLQQYLPAS